MDPATGARLLVALKRADGKVTGVLALAEKRSGLAFSRLDRQLVAAVASAAMLALDNLRLRSTTPSPSAPPARECLECSRLNPSDALQCGCGGTLTEAQVPHVLRGTFRLEQRLGAGGMGVVYRAVDLQPRTRGRDQDAAADGPRGRGAIAQGSPGHGHGGASRTSPPSTASRRGGTCRS